MVSFLNYKQYKVSNTIVQKETLTNSQGLQCQEDFNIFKDLQLHNRMKKVTDDKGNIKYTA